MSTIQLGLLWAAARTGGPRGKRVEPAAVDLFLTVLVGLFALAVAIIGRC